MSGKIEISSGTEDLSSMNALDMPSLEEGTEALMGMFFPADADKNTIDASFESIEASIPKSEVPQAGECCGGQGKRPPLASKVIDANGHALITILYDGNLNTGGCDTGVFTGLLDAASENDVVDITIMTTLYNFTMPTCNIFATLSLLSAIQRCKAKVITRAGCLCSVGDCAVWLSGDDRRMSPMGWLAVRQPSSCSGGSLKDMEFRAEDLKGQLKTFTDYIVKKGLLTEDEVTRLYEEQAIIGLSYDELNARISALKD